MKLCWPTRFQTAVSRMAVFLRQEPEFTYLSMEEIETGWLVSIIWDHHDGGITEAEASHKHLIRAFYMCCDQWLYNREQWTVWEAERIGLIKLEVERHHAT